MTNSADSSRHFQQNPKAPDFVQNPYQLYSHLHALNGPVFWEDYNCWCLAGFDEVYQALRDKRLKRIPPPGAAAPEVAAHLSDFSRVERFSLLALEAPEHTRIRKQLVAAFMNRQIQQLTESITDTANALIDSFAPNTDIELLKHYATPIPLSVITGLLGVPMDAGPQLLSWSRAMVKVYTLTQSVDDEIAANKAALEFEHFLLELIEKRRAEPSTDLLSSLVNPAEGTPLTDAEIVSVCVLLLNAGHEATVHQIGNAVRAILNLDGKPARWFANEEISNATVDEVLRFDAPLHLFQRYAQEDIKLNESVTLKKGEKLSLLLGAANRDSRKFAHADRFDPQRTDGDHVALGAGVHFCVGAALAKLEIKVALRTLFTRLPNLRLAEPTQYLDLYHFHGLEQLIVRPA